MNTRPLSVRPSGLAHRLLGSELVDLLVGPHGVDRYLELVRPSLTLSDARAEITKVRRQTPRSVTLTLQPNAAFGAGYRAGQYVRVGVEIDGVRHSRTFSPASSAYRPDPMDPFELTVTVRQNGVVSTHLRNYARPGDILHLDPAEGDFVLPAPTGPRTHPIALISGGSGITPVLSMLRTLCDEGHAGEIAFVHYGRTPADHLYRPEVEALVAQHRNLHMAYLATRTGDPRLGPDTAPPPALQAVLRDPDGLIAVCGPPPLIESARALAATSAIEPERVLSETFSPPALVLPASGPASGTLRFIASRAQAPVGPGSLLEQAEAAGLRPKHGCRMGICHTCTCRKTEGAVRDLRTGRLSGPGEEDIQICVSAPAGDVALDI